MLLYCRSCGNKHTLSHRQAEVLAESANGLSSHSIGSLLGMTSKTASKHVENAFAKLGVHTRPSAVARALSIGELRIEEGKVTLGHVFNPGDDSL